MLQIKIINTQKALSPTQISIAPYVINPYRGCTMGCVYCYAKNNKNVKSRLHLWGKFLDVKKNLPSILRKELESISVSHVLIGSTCEPFVKEEQKFKITQKTLEILNENKVSYTILTRSIHIKNVLHLIREGKNNKVYFTINFLDFSIKRKFEPFIDYTLHDTIKLIQDLYNLKINFRLYISPFIPQLIKLEDIFSMFGKYCRDFFIEVYNPKMGSWEVVRSILESYLSQNLINIFEDEISYSLFKENFLKEVRLLKRRFPYTIGYYLPPSLNQYYSPFIFYG